MDDSILDNLKRDLGVVVDDDVFDGEIIMAANTAFMTLHQLGVGPSDVFILTDNTQIWNDFTTDVDRLPMIKSYVFIRTRLLFDPPSNSQLASALEDQRKEYEWRLNSAVELPSLGGDNE